MFKNPFKKEKKGEISADSKNLKFETLNKKELNSVTGGVNFTALCSNEKIVPEKPTH
jgi:bacteriocin-like protein